MDTNIRNAILLKYAKVSTNKCIHNPDRYRDFFLYEFFGVSICKDLMLFKTLSGE